MSGYGLEYLVVAFFFALATGIIGKVKGSSFLMWFLIGGVLPIFGLIAVLLYRWESAELRRQCEECGAIVSIADQVCKRCGCDLDFPTEAIVPKLRSAR